MGGVNANPVSGATRHPWFGRVHSSLHEPEWRLVADGPVCVFEGFEAVAGGRYEEQASGHAFPCLIAAVQPYPAAQYEDGGFAGVFVFGQGGAGAQGDEGLAQVCSWPP